MEMGASGAFVPSACAAVSTAPAPSAPGLPAESGLPPPSHVDASSWNVFRSMQLDVARSAKASDATVTFMQWSSLKKIGSLASADTERCCRFSPVSAST
jgi:hypothetical protein